MKGYKRARLLMTHFQRIYDNNERFFSCNCESGAKVGDIYIFEDGMRELKTVVTEIEDGIITFEVVSKSERI